MAIHEGLKRSDKPAAAATALGKKVEPKSRKPKNKVLIKTRTKIQQDIIDKGQAKADKQSSIDKQSAGVRAKAESAKKKGGQKGDDRKGDRRKPQGDTSPNTLGDKRKGGDDRKPKRGSKSDRRQRTGRDDRDVKRDKRGDTPREAKARFIAREGRGNKEDRGKGFKTGGVRAWRRKQRRKERKLKNKDKRAAEQAAESKPKDKPKSDDGRPSREERMKRRAKRRGRNEDR